MNSNFQSYPAHPWLSDWTLEPRGCGTTFREKNAGYFFQTLEIAGRIAPNLETPEWFLQIPIPQNSHFNILFNGFCGYFNQGKHRCLAEVATPEPGVLWGRFSDIPAPVLISDLALEETEGVQWLESDTLPALLAIREGSFCLITKARIFNDATQLAESYLAKDFEAYLSDELEHRAGATKLFAEMNRHDSLAVISAESMMRALRPPEGNISGTWSQSPSSATPQFNTNELCALTLAWKHLDINVAEDLVRSCLKLQTSSGAIPVAYSPHETFTILEAPKPLLAKTAENVWKIRKDPLFLAEIIPLLRRHIQWLLHHFDPKRRGLHCWQNSDELFTPNTYETDLSTVDLTVLLLTEIEALNRLQKATETHTGSPPSFSKERETLENNLQTQFWNEEAGQFSHAIIRGRMATIEGFPTLIPLLWKKLPLRQKTIILDRIKESGTLPGGLSVLSWKKAAIVPYSFSLIQQLLVLETLKTVDPHGSLTSDFVRITLQGFVEWQTLSIKEKHALKLDPVTAAYIVNLQETHNYRYHAKGAITGRLFKLLRKTRTNRFDLAVILITVMAIFSIHVLYDLRQQPPPFLTLEAQMNSAYANKNALETIANGQMIIAYYPEQATMAKVYTANLMMVTGNFKQASVLYAETRKEYPDSPGSMIALGLAYQQQGRFVEADANYAEFTYLFDEIFPKLVTQVERYRYLMQEGFRSPPKWQEIYRYQIMHEL